MTPAEALQLLEFTLKAGAPFVKKLIESAVANASTKSPGVDTRRAVHQQGRGRQGAEQSHPPLAPARHGRATRIQKGMSHITIELDQR